jgi:NADP-dependent 3-hydroxy acid dehydrogenase YdfG
MTPPRNELVVASRASTGVGAATARELASLGYHVLVGVRQVTDAKFPIPVNRLTSSSVMDRVSVH